MKILKKGDERGWWIGKAAECKQCGTVVEIQERDQVTQGFDRNETSARVLCPTCKADIFVYPGSKPASEYLNGST